MTDSKQRSVAVSFLALIASLLLGGALATSLACRTPEKGAEEGPRLVLFLVVDQMRYEYLERFRPLYTGGLARLLDESVVFREAYHEHALTTTAPGHATLATGLMPRHHGIVNNQWFERDGRRAYCVGDRRFGRSPAHLQGSTLGDWLKGADRRSRVFAASGKDRAAILTAGKKADGAFWYDGDRGTFTTSGYYGTPPPAWLLEFGEQELADAEYGKAWEPSPEAAAAGEERGILDLDRGLFQIGFPHVPGGLSALPEDDFYGDLYSSPFVDAYLARFAEILVEAEHLGQDGHVDFLGLSFSAVDTVGHDWGPNSREVLDTLLRLDAALGRLLAFLDEEVGLDHVVISLSADHGVASMPEYRQVQGMPGRRMTQEDKLCFQHLGRELATHFGDADLRLVDSHGRLRPDSLEDAGLDRAEVEAEARRLVERCPGVARVWTRSELLAEPVEQTDPYGRLYAASFHPDRSPDFLVQFEADYLPLPDYLGTTHGTPYPHDSHVPWLLRLPGVSAREVSARVATVDVAPTLGALLGVPVPTDRDGVDRSSLLRPPG